MSVLSTLNELKNITDNFHLNSNKDTVIYGIVDFQNPLDISEKNHIEDIFKKFEFIKLPENFLNKFIQTNNQSINLSKGLDSFRELFNQKELKTFKIKNHSQVSEYINKFELVFNYTCSQSIDPSILHNIMLQCKLHGTTDKVINSIRTKPKV